MKPFKQVLMTGVVAFSVSACHGYKKPDPAPAPVGPPDHTLQTGGGTNGGSVPQHDPAACPRWNGDYTGSTNVYKRMKTDFDSLGSPRLEDQTVGSIWIVNGKPQWINGHPKKGEPEASYSAFCAEQIPPFGVGPGIKIEVYQDGKHVFDVFYIMNRSVDSKGNAFDYIYADANDKPIQRPDTFVPRGSPLAPAPMPLPPQPSPSPAAPQ